MYGASTSWAVAVVDPWASLPLWICKATGGMVRISEMLAAFLWWIYYGSLRL
jgi:hypothetical protein